MATSERKKTVFERELRGDPVGYDMLGNPLIEGDYVAYASSAGSHRIDMKLGKIISVVEGIVRVWRRGNWNPEATTKIKIHRVECRTGADGTTEWTRGHRPSRLSNFTHVIRIHESDLPERVLNIFAEMENEESS